MSELKKSVFRRVCLNGRFRSHHYLPDLVHLRVEEWDWTDGKGILRHNYRIIFYREIKNYTTKPARQVYEEIGCGTIKEVNDLLFMRIKELDGFDIRLDWRSPPMYGEIIDESWFTEEKR